MSGISSNQFMNIGTIGHVDDGKTTLSAAISKICRGITGGGDEMSYADIDNAPEEKARGITINRRHILVRTENRDYGLIDCPGHKDYVKNMITGAAQMYVAILVVSASSGVMSQTREHILLAKCVGIQHIIVFLNKIDTVKDPELVEFAEMDIRETLSKYDYDGDNATVIKGSALCALEGHDDEMGKNAILELMKELDSIEQPASDSEKPLLMPIEGVHSIAGRGTVVTGCIDKGTINVGDEVAIVGLKETRKTTCTGIETFHKSMPTARAGESIGILLRGIKREEVERGQFLTKPGSINPHDEFKAEIFIIKKEDGGRHTPFFSNYRPQFFISTADITGVITLPENVEMALPGDNLTISVKLIQKAALEKGTRFAMREGGKTIGYGIVSDVTN